MILVSEESIYKQRSWNTTILVLSASLWSPIRYLRSFYLWFLILHECMNSCTRPHQPHTYLIFISNIKSLHFKKQTASRSLVGPPFIVHVYTMNPPPHLSSTESTYQASHVCHIFRIDNLHMKWLITLILNHNNLIQAPRLIR